MSMAQDLFADMGRKVEEMRANGDRTEGADDDEEVDSRVVDEIESLCMNCHEDGITKLLLTRIPFFREIVIMSFYCDHCHFKNSEIQSAGEIQQRGSKYTLKLDSDADFERQVVKSDGCVFRVDDIDLEIPPGRGQYSNVEGILRMVLSDLESHQEDRRKQMPEVAAQLDVVLEKLRNMLDGSSFPFTISIDDPAGNSWIEPSPRDHAGKYTRREYLRTREQNEALGLEDGKAQRDGTGAPDTEIRPEYKATQMTPAMPDGGVNNVDADDEIVENRVYSFPATCPGCMKPCDTNMKMVNIPHFKQVVVMSTVCDHCGYRSNEIKTGGEIPEKGCRITMSVERPEDLARDILKSESCRLICPGLELDVQPGTVGGRFTTIEGLLTQFRDDLHSSVFGMDDTEGTGGDSLQAETKATWDAFFSRLTLAIDGKLPFTLIMEDPLASSYVQSFTAPAPDPQIEVEEYERSFDEMEHLGLNDIKTEGYENDAEPEEAQEHGEVAAAIADPSKVEGLSEEAVKALQDLEVSDPAVDAKHGTSA
ncbi:hypothetical protein B0A49_06715 [Cryomyces minteri]|uniref:Zinc finger ZPR1-type domain-containing protein n=1 Tax=Cryomyces minteri TaxID=331657 RepID=A0A4U0WXP4_9PEZI|nr:hypothetical protein B0A49_06715 [Cryomyces minteri]